VPKLSRARSTGSLTGAHDDRNAGVLSCLRPKWCDRDAFHGVLRRGNDEVSLRDRGFAFRYPQFGSDAARPRARAGGIAGAQAGITIEHIAKQPHPQGSRRGGGAETTLANTRPSACHLAMEACGAYQPWHYKQTHKDLRAAGQRQVPTLLFLFIATGSLSHVMIHGGDG